MKMLSTGQAADLKGCTRQTIRYALDTGRLNGEKVGKVRVILADKVFREWEPNRLIAEAVKERWAKQAEADGGR